MIKRKHLDSCRVTKEKIFLSSIPTQIKSLPSNSMTVCSFTNTYLSLRKVDRRKIINKIEKSYFMRRYISQIWYSFDDRTLPRRLVYLSWSTTTTSYYILYTERCLSFITSSYYLPEPL